MKNFTQIFIGGRGRVYALDEITGNPLWENRLKYGFFKSVNDLVSLLETDRHLYAFSYGTLYRLIKSSGNIEWQTHIPHLEHHVGLLAVDGYTNSIEVGFGCGGDSNSDGGGDGVTEDIRNTAYRTWRRSPIHYRALS